MTVEDALLAQIRAAPEDDELRLVYADALLERGDPRGELVLLDTQGAEGDRPDATRLHAAAVAKRVRRGRGTYRNTVDFVVSREIGNSINLSRHDHYAFIHKLEEHEHGRLVVHFECTTVAWMDKARSEIVATGAAPG